MKLPIFLLRFGMTTIALLWMHLWKWCHPNSAAVIDELAQTELQLIDRVPTLSRSIGFCVSLPGIARSQQHAESTSATRTKGNSLVVFETRWKGFVRESLIWTVVLGWAVVALSIMTSYAQTGNFLFEYGPDSGRPEVVTPYFKIVAVSLMIQLGTLGTGLSALKIARQDSAAVRPLQLAPQGRHSELFADLNSRQFAKLIRTTSCVD